MFQAFDLDEVLIVEDESWHISLEAPVYDELPWINPLKWGLNPEYNYGFDLFMGIFEKDVANQIVQELYRDLEAVDVFDDTRDSEGSTCVLRIGVSLLGELMIEDCRISTLPWALSTLRRKKDLSLDAFDSFGRDLQMRIVSCRESLDEAGDGADGGGDSIKPLSWGLLKAINAEVHRNLDIEWREFYDRIVIVARKLGKKKPHAVADTTVVPADQSADLGGKIDLEGDGGAPLSSSSSGRGAPSVGSATHTRIRRRCEILNSFFLRDLQRVAQASTDLKDSSTLSSYILATPHDARIDVAKPSKALWERVSLKALPLGRWPHHPKHFNSLMQQLAINEHCSAKHLLFAVNGPPGTGKTTLVKDIVAASVVQRALKLVRYRSPDDAFERGYISCEVDRSRYSVRRLKRELLGFEVLVGSSNNNAVENITRELPKRSSLGEQFQGASYLGEVARLYEDVRLRMSEKLSGRVVDYENWGLISAPLGNRRNRELFCDALLYGPREEREEKLKRQNRATTLTIHEWRKQVPPEGMLSYSKARLELLEAHKRVEEILEQLTAHGELKGDRTLTGLDGGADTDCAFIPPCEDDFDSLSVQARAPWLSERLNEAQSQLFVAALGLHQAWLRESEAFKSNLVALGRLLSKPDAFEEDIARVLWQSLFMIVPAVSTTLASVERMCSSVGPGVFGTVVVEEAGQATPQSVVGLLWRAKRGLLIGDPMQIQPVVSAPEVLVRHLCKKHGLNNAIYSPLASSAQSLADESNELGTYLDHGFSNTWVGAPLRVHRRCIEPMFSISNTIAYGGLMTYGTDARPHLEARLASLPQSAWYDVEGSCIGRHWIPQHGEVAVRLMERMILGSFATELDIFFITPFRSIRERLANLVYERARKVGCSRDQALTLRRRVGTVHTFQGKEASVVVFVLGCDESMRGSARWAGERPNLVNVAVTRARQRLFVVGSLSLWHNQGVFSELASSLPRIRGG